MIHGTTGNPPVPRIGQAVPISRVFEARYGKVDPWGDYGQHRLLFLQVFCDNTVPGKTEYPAGFKGLGMLTVTLQFDFEGKVSPASCDGTNSTVVQSKTDEQVFNIPGCYNGVLNNRSALYMSGDLEQVIKPSRY